MPSSIHEVLLNGACCIIEKALLYIGQLSEEALTKEPNNKMFKRCWEGFVRTFSRNKQNEDALDSLSIIGSFHHKFALIKIRCRCGAIVRSFGF